MNPNKAFKRRNQPTESVLMFKVPIDLIFKRLGELTLTCKMCGSKHTVRMAAGIKINLNMVRCSRCDSNRWRWHWESKET